MIQPVGPIGIPTMGIGEERMRQSYAIAGNLLRDGYARTDPGKLRTLERLVPSDLVVVDGTYDHIHLMFEAVRFPHTRIRPEEVSARSLEAAKAVFINCSEKFPESSARRLARFVGGGGLLLTTDWGLKNVLEVAFPGFVRHNGRSTGNEVVSVKAADQENPLTAHFRRAVQPAWWLETDSYPLERLHQGVEVLLTSSELRRRHGHGSIAVRFPFGDGRVYHLVSHLFLQQAQTRDAAHGLAARDFASPFASEETMTQVYNAERSGSGINFGSVQAAMASAGFVSEILIDDFYRPEPPTFMESVTGILKMLMPPKKEPRSWKPRFNANWDLSRVIPAYRMPRDLHQVTFGREGDETIEGDPTLSRQHATIRRVPGGKETDFALTAHHLTTTFRNGREIVLDHGQSAWLLSGDRIQLTSGVGFVFEIQ